MRLVALGFGFTARAFVAEHGGLFSQVTGTARAPGRQGPQQVTVLPFDGLSASPELHQAVARAEMLLVSIGPDAGGDPTLRCLAREIAAAPHLSYIAYLSTVGVYGDHGGGWVTEATPCRPVSARSVARRQAEEDWLALGRTSGQRVQILRLAGIYGPGRNALGNLRAGTARRIDKPGQVFNRIHVSDIAGLLAAAMAAPHAPALLNVADDEPCPPQDVVAYAARLLGREPPPLTPFAEAEMTPMARSFYGENKRVSNAAAKAALGYRLRYPSYREGLAALLASGE